MFRSVLITSLTNSIAPAEGLDVTSTTGSCRDLSCDVREDLSFVFDASRDESSLRWDDLPFKASPSRQPTKAPTSDSRTGTQNEGERCWMVC